MPDPGSGPAAPPPYPGGPGGLGPLVEPVPQPLCASDALAERGRAVGFEVLLWGQPTRAFALRFEGQVVAYINRCAHVPVEMDWQPGEFLDSDKRWIICSIHGASYAPEDGRCVGGPCGRGKLIRIALREADGQVSWYPSADVRPLAAPVANAPGTR